MHARHLTDAELAQYAIDPDSLPAERRQYVEKELSVCAECRTSVDFFAVIRAEDLLELEPAPPSADDPMLAYLKRIAEEDEEADEVIAQEGLFASPMKTAWMNLERNKRLLNGGVVRRLVAHANSVCQDEPLDALTFAECAISIAETLPDDTYPWKAIFELRATAWKERANAFMVRGNYPAALESLDHAERAYRHLKSNSFGLATVALVRASVLYEQGVLDDAARWAEKAEHGFAHLGEEDRRMRAVFLRGSVRHQAGDIGNALLLFRQVLDYGEAINNQRWLARAAYAIGNCEIDVRNLADASMHFHRALVIFRAIGPEWDRLATEWGLARVVLYGGNHNEGILRLRHVASGYEQRSMLSDGALVWLDIVEALLALGETKQVAEIATRLARIFRQAGMITGTLTAAAYLKEAATAGKLTQNDVKAVRTYLNRARRQPLLAFERPSESFR